MINRHWLRGMKATLLLLATGAPASAQRGAPAADSAFRVVPCRVRQVEGTVQCGRYWAAENREKPGGPRIPIDVLVLKARSATPAADPIFVFVGGPGLAASGYAAAWGRRAERETRDIVLANLRGTSDGNRLDCDLPGSERDPRGYLSTMFPLEPFRRCRDRLSQIADLTRYTSWDAADDYDEIRQRLGYQKINLVGTSSGTRQILVYLARHPGAVRSAILDGVAPPGVAPFAEHARSAQEGLDSIVAECRRQSACASAFPDLPGDLKMVRTALEAKPAVATLEDSGRSLDVSITWPMFGEALRVLTYYSRNVPRVPLLVHRAAAGDFAPFVEAAIESNRSLRDLLRFGLNVSMACSEDAPLVRDGDIARLTRDTYLGDVRAREELAICAEWPRGPRPADFDRIPASVAPVLLLSGKADPATPPRYGELAARSLRNARHVVFPSSHGQGSACADSIRREFLRSLSLTALDASCVERMTFPRFITAAPTAPPQTPPRIASYVDSVVTTFGRGDTARALAFLETALRLSPDNVVFLDGMVRMRGRLRDTASLLATLPRLGATGGGRPVSSEPIFRFIAGHPEFERLARLNDSTLVPLRRADTVLAMRDTTLSTEAIAVDAADPAGLTVYANGGGGRIVRVRGQGEAQTMTTLVATGATSMLGMRIDARRRLWAAVNFRAADSTQRSRAELIAVDLASGDVVRRYRSPIDGRDHLFNDIALDSTGTVYVTDFDAHALYVAAPGSDSLRLFHADDPWFSRANGVVVSPDGRRLYVAHFDGVTAWDLVRGTRTLLTAPRSVSLVNIDGLYACGGSLVGVQTLPGVGRVIRFDLDATGTHVTGQVVLDRDSPTSRRIATGYSVGNELFFPARGVAPRSQRTVVQRVVVSPTCR